MGQNIKKPTCQVLKICLFKNLCVMPCFYADITLSTPLSCDVVFALDFYVEQYIM